MMLWALLTFHQVDNVVMRVSPDGAQNQTNDNEYDPHRVKRLRVYVLGGDWVRESMPAIVSGQRLNRDSERYDK